MPLKRLHCLSSSFFSAFATVTSSRASRGPYWRAAPFGGRRLLWLLRLQGLPPAVYAHQTLTKAGHVLARYRGRCERAISLILATCSLCAWCALLDPCAQNARGIGVP